MQTNHYQKLIADSQAGRMVATDFNFFYTFAICAMVLYFFRKKFRLCQQQAAKDSPMKSLF